MFLENPGNHPQRDNEHLPQRDQGDASPGVQQWAKQAWVSACGQLTSQ